ncbi:MAG: type II toxin-antitoxin system PemK/MazF family toxin [Verrucomicrobiota bacterium]
MNQKPGDVWLADLGLAGKTRPVVILSRDDSQAPRALVIYVPLTTQHRGSRYEVAVGQLQFLNEASVANVQGIASLPPQRFERKLGVLPVDVLSAIKLALAFAVEM